MIEEVQEVNEVEVVEVDGNIDFQLDQADITLYALLGSPPPGTMGFWVRLKDIGL